MIGKSQNKTQRIPEFQNVVVMRSAQISFDFAQNFTIFILIRYNSWIFNLFNCMFMSTLRSLLALFRTFLFNKFLYPGCARKSTHRKSDIFINIYIDCVSISYDMYIGKHFALFWLWDCLLPMILNFDLVSIYQSIMQLSWLSLPHLLMLYTVTI